MPEAHAAKPRIELNGSPLAPEFDVDLEMAIVDDHLILPDMFLLRFRDPGRSLLSRAGFDIGGQVRILAGPTGGEATELLVSGEVTALEAELDATGSHAVVRGYDHSHRLHRGRHTETYRNVTDAEIARRVAERAGIEVGQIEPTDVTHTHVSQVNLTDWEFLKARAREIGYEVVVLDGKLDFRPPPVAGEAPATGDLTSTDPLQLVVGSDLDAFQPRVTSAEQVRDVEVRGWDPARKEVVVGTAPAETSSAQLSVSPADLAARFGSPTYVQVDRPLSTQAEVDAAARALAERIAGAFAEAEGTAQGNPKLRAGTAVSVGLTGDTFDGRYTVTATRHVFDQAGYRTNLVVSGKQERSLLGLASLGATGGTLSAGGPPIYGVVNAIVTDVADPEDLGRVKVRFPWLADNYESDWARVLQAGAGTSRGMVILPEVNDEVLVAFEHGDARRPYIIGSLYNGVDTPKLGDGLIDGSTGAVKRRGFISKLGHALVFFDADDKKGVAVLTADRGLRISLNSTKTTIRINSSGAVEIEGSTDVTVKAGANLSLEATSQLQLKGAQVSIEASGPVAVKGNPIQLN